MGRGPEQTFLQRRHADGQQTHETMLRITQLQGNANHNYEISPHTCWKSKIQNTRNNSIGKDVEKKEHSCTIGGNANWCSQSKTELPRIQ